MNAYTEHTFATAIKKLMKVGFDSVIREGGTPYLVGGFVRDAMLGKDPKDIDVVIDGMSMSRIMEVLAPYGKLDLVGKSFAVLKFTVGGETIDVAVPRKDEHVEGGGHRDVIVKTENVGIGDDLFRRDFTINAMAVDFNMRVLDPTYGIKDLENKIIRCVDSDVFAMDPLRMLRAVVFAVRFGFKLEGATSRNITEHAEWIKRIPGERFEAELRKAWKAGASVGDLMRLLYVTGLYEEMFELRSGFTIGPVEDPGMTCADFFYQLLSVTRDPKGQWLGVMKGDLVTGEEIGTIHHVLNFATGKTQYQVRQILQHAIEHAPGVIESTVLNSVYGETLEKFRNGTYPKTRLELAVRGKDLVDMGVAPEDRTYVFNRLMELVLGDIIENKRDIMLLEARKINNAINNDE